MEQINIQLLENASQEMKSIFQDTLLSTGIWECQYGLNLVAINPRDELTLLFNELTEKISTILRQSKLNLLSNYYMIELENQQLLVIIVHGTDLLQWLLVCSDIDITMLINEAIPKVIQMVKSARVKS